MSGEHVTIEMFKLWTDSHKDTLASFMSELKDVKIEQVNATRELKETNTLLREDVSAQKQLLELHQQTYKSDKESNETKFNTIFETLRSREDLYRAGKLIKWGGAILVAGMLAAGGKSIYDGISFTPIREHKIDKSDTPKPN